MVLSDGFLPTCGLVGAKSFRAQNRLAKALEYGEALEDDAFGVAVERDHEQVQVFGSRF